VDRDFKSGRNHRRGRGVCYFRRDPKSNRLGWKAHENAETANDLRERIFELRFPNRMIEHEGADRPLAVLLAQIRNAPTAGAFLAAWGSVALSALRAAYREFLERSILSPTRPPTGF
jgi:hypothetical protein